MKDKIWRIYKDFTVLEEKIPSIRSQMTGENGEFQSKSTDIRLTIQIEVKMGEKKPHLKSMEKISQLYTTQFPQSDLKWQEKMKNFKVNPGKFDWAFKSKWKWKKKNSFQRQNLQNFAVLEENIPSIKCEMIGENVEFPVGSREIRSTIQAEV